MEIGDYRMEIRRMEIGNMTDYIYFLHSSGFNDVCMVDLTITYLVCR